jgi:hypothetical protein
VNEENKLRIREKTDHIEKVDNAEKDIYEDFINNY